MQSLGQGALDHCSIPKTFNWGKWNSFPLGILIGEGIGVPITNLLQMLFTFFYLLHWPVNTDNERELIKCHLSEFTLNYCLHLSPHQPLCSKIVRKILSLFDIAACSESR